MARGATSSPPVSRPRRHGTATSTTRSTSCSRSPCSTAWCGWVSVCRRATTIPRARPRISIVWARRSAPWRRPMPTRASRASRPPTFAPWKRWASASPIPPVAGAKSRWRKPPDGRAIGPAAADSSPPTPMMWRALLLGDVPHHRHRAGEPAREAVLAVGAEGLVLAEHDVHALVHHAVLHGHGDLLLLVGIDLAGVS